MPRVNLGVSVELRTLFETKPLMGERMLAVQQVKRMFKTSREAEKRRSLVEGVRTSPKVQSSIITREKNVLATS